MLQELIPVVGLTMALTLLGLDRNNVSVIHYTK